MSYSLDTVFKYHAPKGTQTKRYEALRETGKEFAVLILRWCPDSRERSIALTNLEQSIMWANAAIARNEADPC